MSIQPRNVNATDDASADPLEKLAGELDGSEQQGGTEQPDPTKETTTVKDGLTVQINKEPPQAIQTDQPQAATEAVEAEAGEGTAHLDDSEAEHAAEAEVQPLADPREMEWPPRMSAKDLPTGYTQQGSTGIWYVVKDGTWQTMDQQPAGRNPLIPPNARAISDRGALSTLRDGEKFLATFLHNHLNHDDVRHVKSIMGELISGKSIRHYISPTYWMEFSHLRPPIAVRDVRNPDGYRILE